MLDVQRSLQHVIIWLVVPGILPIFIASGRIYDIKLLSDMFILFSIILVVFGLFRADFPGASATTDSRSNHRSVIRFQSVFSGRQIIWRVAIVVLGPIVWTALAAVILSIIKPFRQDFDFVHRILEFWQASLGWMTLYYIFVALTAVLLEFGLRIVFQYRNRQT